MITGPRWVLCCVAMVAMLAAGGAAAARPQRYYRFGVLPLQSPTMLARMFLPLADALQQALHRPVQFVTAPNFSAFMRRVRRHQYDIIYLNPLLYTRARRWGYHVVVKVAGEPFTGILVVRRDSGIRRLGRRRLSPRLRIGFPDPNAYAATIMTRQYMAARGIHVSRDMKVKYFGSQDSALMAVYYGMVDVAGAWYPSLRSMPPHVQASLRVIAQTPPQPQMPIAVRDDMPASDVKRVTQLLTHLTTTARGRAALAHLGFNRGFVIAHDSEYDGVKP
ncbi:MAG: phosphate/phosphite/phosphonate ABC transporter substrate-binding protein [Betaproteobacteria bacterium]|nr:phosphate/phosphite/phosphonate ABC transporter substrate-binding protein [Betaproteobacteria bacterium]